MQRSRVGVLGVEVDPVTADELVARIGAAVAAGDRLLIGNHNLHSAHLVRTEAAMRDFYARADLIYVDGMPLVAADRLGSRTLERRHRSTLLDWLDPLLVRAGEGRWSVHLLGSTPEAIERAGAVLAERHPDVRLTWRHGWFADGDEEEAVLRQLDEVRPDLLLVGMGMPRQEAWLAAHADRLPATVAIAVGGLFDYVAGVTVTPPRWMGRLGLEWLARLVSDPRRLGRRYLVEPVLLGRALLRERR